jgi:hypothetical protein
MDVKRVGFHRVLQPLSDGKLCFCCGCCHCCLSPPCAVPRSSPYLAAACSQVLTDNGFPAASHTTICTPSLSALRIGPTAGVDVPNVCNCLVADILDDGLLSGGLIPAVANALEELLVRERPVLVPQQVTVVAQAVGVRPSVVEVPLDRSGQGGSSGSSDSCGGNTDGSSTVRLDLTALDAYRCAMWSAEGLLSSVSSTQLQIQCLGSVGGGCGPSRSAKFAVCLWLLLQVDAQPGPAQPPGPCHLHTPV